MRIMNSKVIKWFIRQTGIKKSDGTENKKSSLVKDRSVSFRKFSLSRLSLRKRRKQQDSSNPEEEEFKYIKFADKQQMSSKVGSNTNQTCNKDPVEHTYSNIPINSSTHSSGRDRIVTQSSADAGFNRDDGLITEEDSFKRSSNSLPDQFSIDDHIEIENEVEDSTEKSECEESNSDSAATVKRIDNLDEDSLIECTEILSHNSEIIHNCSNSTKSIADEDELPNDVPSYDLENQKEIICNKSSSIGDTHASVDSVVIINNSTGKATTTASIECELNGNLSISENTSIDLQKNFSDTTPEAKMVLGVVDMPQISSSDICEGEPNLTIDESIKTKPDGKICEESAGSENKVNANSAEHIPIKNSDIPNQKYDFEDDSKNGEASVNAVLESKKLSINSSSESLSKSNGHNEYIAAFDDDGDISAISPPMDIESSITKNQKYIENNVKQLKKLKLLYIKNIKNRSTETSPMSSNSANNQRKSSSKESFVDEEISKVKIVITQPSPEKSSTNTHSSVELSSNTNFAISHEQYPEGLNPFDDESDGERPKDTHQTQKFQKLHNTEEKSHNPFGSDSEEDRELEAYKKLNSSQNGLRGRNVDVAYRRKESNDNSKNPFALYEDIENSRLSTTNPFADESDDNLHSCKKISRQIHISKTDKPPSLPPKLDYRLRQGSLSSTPIPHPRKSKQRLHGSSNSLNVTSFHPVPYPRSVVPSGSSETLNLSQDGEDMSNFTRGGSRSSLPGAGQIRFSRKKRTAPRPPNEIQAQRSLSIDRTSLRRPDNFKYRNGQSSIASTSHTNQPPPRPPPPKKQLKDYNHTIKEKFLRIM